MNARPQRTLCCALCRRELGLCNTKPCTNKAKGTINFVSGGSIGTSKLQSSNINNRSGSQNYPVRTPAVTRIPSTSKKNQSLCAPTPLTARLMAEKIKPDKMICKKSDSAWGINNKKEEGPPLYDIESTLANLIAQEPLVINQTTGKPQIELIHFLNDTCKLIGKSFPVSVAGYDMYGMIVDMTVELSTSSTTPNTSLCPPTQKWHLHTLHILWFDFPWEVASWPPEKRVAMSLARVPVGSTFKARVVEARRDWLRLAPSKYACPELKLDNSFVPLAGPTKCPYRYLIALDLEATCDYCPNPKVTAQTAEIIEFPWIVIDTRYLRIIDEQQIYVRPDNLEGITKYATKLTGISKEMVRKKGNLEDTIKLFDDYIKRKFGNSKEFRIITDGIWDLQVQLHKEAEKKRIPLAWYFKEYLDLKDEFRKFFPWFPESYRPDLRAMLKALSLEFVGKPHKGIDDSRNIAQIVTTLLPLGHIFNSPKCIPPNYDPYSDPKFVDFGSVTEPDAWQCSNLPSCGVWNRPWLDKCKFCSSIKHARLQPHHAPPRKM